MNRPRQPTSHAETTRPGRISIEFSSPDIEGFRVRPNREGELVFAFQLSPDEWNRAKRMGRQNPEVTIHEELVRDAVRKGTNSSDRFMVVCAAESTSFALTIRGQGREETFRRTLPTALVTQALEQVPKMYAATDVITALDADPTGAVRKALRQLLGKQQPTEMERIEGDLDRALGTGEAPQLRVVDGKNSKR